MGLDSCRLTVYFEAPFWVGVFERTRSGALFAARVVFGAEPKDYEAYARVLKEYARLRFSPAVESAAHAEIRNPKRARRAAAKLTGSAGPVRAHSRRCKCSTSSKSANAGRKAARKRKRRSSAGSSRSSAKSSRSTGVIDPGAFACRTENAPPVCGLGFQVCTIQSLPLRGRWLRSEAQQTDEGLGALADRFAASAKPLLLPCPHPPQCAHWGTFPTPFVPAGHFPLTGGIGPGGEGFWASAPTPSRKVSPFLLPAFSFGEAKENAAYH